MRRGLVLLLWAAALLAAPGAWAQGTEPDPPADPPAGDAEPTADPDAVDAPEPEPEPDSARDSAPDSEPERRRSGSARGRFDGGIADAFMEGFRQGMREGNAGSGAGGEPELTDDEAAAVGLASLCCCFLFLVGLVVLVVVLVKKSGRSSASGATGVTGGTGVTGAAGAPSANPYARAQPSVTHLSVLAVAFDARRRQLVEGAVRARVAGSPVTQEQRAELVRALCGALLEVSSNWRAFGYGDKTDFADDRAAETSFRAAWSDFKGRCAGPGEPGGELCVAVLVLCSRGELLGTTRLDDPEQARALVQHRLGAAPGSLLAADCFFAPASADQGALSTGDAYRRFPEMQRLLPPATRP